MSFVRIVNKEIGGNEIENVHYSQDEDGIVILRKEFLISSCFVGMMCML